MLQIFITIYLIKYLMTVVRKKDRLFFFLKPSLDISQLTSVAVKSLLLSDPNVTNTWICGVL